MRNAPLIVLLLTLGCTEKYPPEMIVEGQLARLSAYEGDPPDAKGTSISQSAAAAAAADLDDISISREYAGAVNIDPSVPTTTAEPEAEAAEADVRGGDFSKGTRFANVYGSTIFGDEGKGEMYLLHAGLGYHVADYQSISLDVLGGYVRSGIDDNGGVIGFDVVYRNHFHRDENDKWTLFFEGGLGLQEQSTNFSGERHFNFRTRVGLGASFKIDDHVRAFVGATYQHLSDAGIDESGGGFDGPMLWAGVTFPF